MNNKVILSVAGTVAALASTFALIDYTHRKGNSKPSPTGELIFALAAATAGSVLSSLADKLDGKEKLAAIELPKDADDELIVFDPIDSASDENL